jgi:hypothetical protein
MKFHHIRRRLEVLVALLFVVAATSLQAQSPASTRLHTTNTHAWLMYFGNHKFADRWGLHAEVQWRRHDLLSESQQLLLRTGLDYYLKDSHRLTVGYAFVETYPYGEFAVANAFPEHRIWQQLATAHMLGKVKLAHRYRVEQRMIGNASTGAFKDGRFEHRFRYMAKATVNVTSGDRPVFGAIYNEIFINAGKDVGYNLFDQNRLYAALGFTFSPVLKMELGYLYQVVQLRSLDPVAARNRIEDNHTLQLGIYSTIGFN